MKTETMLWPDRRGREVALEVNLSIEDIQKFRGTAGYVWLIIAANPHLSVAAIQEWLATQSPDCLRPKTWITKRRWIFHPKFSAGGQRNADGKDERAAASWPTLSFLFVTCARLLAQHGISRSREWVRRNRVTHHGP